MGALCAVLGAVKVTDKDQVPDIQARIKDQEATKANKQKLYPAPRKDGNDRDRYMQPFHVDELEERPVEDGEPYWMWFRNAELLTLNLADNAVSNIQEVEAVEPFGTGTLVLKGNPVAKPLLDKREQEAEGAAAAQAKAKAAEENEGGDEEEAPAAGED